MSRGKRVTLSVVVSLIVVLIFCFLLDVAKPPGPGRVSSRQPSVAGSIVDHPSTEHVSDTVAVSEDPVVFDELAAGEPGSTEEAEAEDTEDLAEAPVEVVAAPLDATSDEEWGPELRVDLAVEFPAIGATSWRPVWHKVYVAGAGGTEAVAKNGAKLHLATEIDARSEIDSGLAVTCEAALRLEPLADHIAVAVLVQFQPVTEDGDLPGHLFFFAGHRRFTVAESEAGRITLRSNAPALGVTIRSKESSIIGLSMLMKEKRVESSGVAPPTVWSSFVASFITELRWHRQMLAIPCVSRTDRFGYLRLHELPVRAFMSDWARIRDESNEDEYWILDYHPSETAHATYRSDWKNTFFIPIDGQELVARRDDPLPFPEISIVGDPPPGPDALAVATISCGLQSLDEYEPPAGDTDSASFVRFDPRRWATARFDTASESWLWRSIHGRHAVWAWSEGSASYTFRLRYRLSIPGYETAFVSADMRGDVNPPIEFHVVRKGADTERP